MEGHSFEHIFRKKALNGDADAASLSRIDMKNFHKMSIVIDVTTSVAEALPVTLRQHDALSGGNSKDLVMNNPYFVRLTADDVGSKVDAPELATFNLQGANGSAGLYVLEVLGEDMDVDNQFSFLSLDFGDLTAARVVAVHYESVMPRYKPAYQIEA